MKPTVGAALTAAVSRASGFAGAAPPRPPARPPRPARPPAGALASAGADTGAGAGIGADSAASNGARSASVDQRDSSIDSGGSAAPTEAARSVSTRPSAARVVDTHSVMAHAIATPARVVPLLSITVVGAFGAAEPLHQ